MRSQMSLVAVTLAASLTGCATTGGGQRSADGSDPDRMEVLVQNHNWADMNVYLERGGMRTRLGTVTTASTRVFVVPRGISSRSGSFRLLADPIGGSATYMTAPLLISPGQTVEFTIENHVNISSVAVWN
jgi:hypothetical protein